MSEGLVIKGNLTKTEDIHHARVAKHGLGNGTMLVNMNMAVQVQCGLENFVQPAEGLDALVGAVFSVLDLPGRGMADEDVQIAAFCKFVEHHVGDKT